MNADDIADNQCVTLPDAETEHLVRLLRTLLDGYVPKAHAEEAEALASAIEVHVREMTRRLIGESFGVGVLVAIAFYKNRQDRGRLVIPDDLLHKLLTVAPDQIH